MSTQHLSLSAISQLLQTQLWPNFLDPIFLANHFFIKILLGHKMYFDYNFFGTHDFVLDQLPISSTWYNLTKLLQIYHNKTKSIEINFNLLIDAVKNNWIVQGRLLYWTQLISSWLTVSAWLSLSSIPVCFFVFFMLYSFLLLLLKLLLWLYLLLRITLHCSSEANMQGSGALKSHFCVKPISSCA